MESISHVDISKIGLKTASVSMEDEKDLASKLKLAFSKCGFVYLSGHGIEQPLIDGLFKQTKSFFEDLPTAEKEKSCPRDGSSTQGYVRQGFEKLDVHKLEDGDKSLIEMKESLDVVSLAPGSSFPDPTHPELRPAIQEFGQKMKTLAHRVLRTLALALNREVDFFEANHTKILQHPGSYSKIRFLYYPKIEGVVSKEMIRCGEHSDYGTITLLFQDTMGGLEVKSVHGGWIEAKPKPGCILLNIGDMMEIWSSGLFRATRHRVRVPEEETRRRAARQSAVMFVHPDDECEVRPLLINDEGRSGKSDPVKAGDYTRRQFEKTYF